MTEYYNADLYLRLSKEDGDKEESDSITNQKELILDFLKSRSDIRIHKIRVDDGYSGVNFERPAFQQMLEDIKTGEVNCVITKDLSRFGRNYIETGKYLERIFPYLGIRFIAVNDNYDSAESETYGNSMMIPFKNLINDAYCRDISIKIRSSLEVKRKRGDFIGAFAPYGYKKSTEDKNRLVIDEEAAEIVRYIFRMYLQGNNAYRIAETLNKKDIPTPMDYKKENGSRFYTGFKRNMESEWTHGSVLRILKDPVYAGILVQGKNTTPNYKVKKKVKREERQWSSVENTHEAIIPPFVYNNVREILHTDTRTASSQEKVYCLSGIVKCGDCGANMVRKTVSCGRKKFVYYVCSNHKYNKNLCSSHSINESKLEECVLKALNFQIKMTVHMGVIADELKKKKGGRTKAERKKQLAAKKEEEIQRICSRKSDLYEDYEEGLLTKEECLEWEQIYEKRIQKMESALTILNREMDSGVSETEDFAEWMEELTEEGQMPYLSREAAVFFIEKILVYKKTGKHCPEIEIFSKFGYDHQEVSEKDDWKGRRADGKDEQKAKEKSDGAL